MRPSELSRAARTSEQPTTYDTVRCQRICIYFTITGCIFLSAMVTKLRKLRRAFDSEMPGSSIANLQPPIFFLISHALIGLLYKCKNPPAHTRIFNDTVEGQ